jgi:hypothetical protein
MWPLIMIVWIVQDYMVLWIHLYDDNMHVCISYTHHHIFRTRLARWNVSDSGLNHLEQFETGKNRNVLEVNRFETFEVFVLQPWNEKIGVSSDSDWLPSHFHWIWNVSTNGANDFTKWIWFDQESFLEINWNVSDSQWILNCTKCTFNMLAQL